MKDYYQILEIDKKATVDEIKKAYRKLAKKYHPDVNKEESASEKFKELTEAYEVLSNNSKRRNYDLGSNSFGSNSFGSSSFYNPFGGDLFGFRPTREPQGRKQSHTRVTLVISLKEAKEGCEKEVEFKDEEICKDCNGEGASEYEKCSYCNGVGYVQSQSKLNKNSDIWIVRQSCSICNQTGRVPKESCKTCSGSGTINNGMKKTEVEIPPGISDGSQLRVRGQGPANSDLFVRVVVKEDEGVVRKGNHLFSSLDVDYPTLILGGEEEFELFGEKLSVKIKPKTEVGSTLRLQGQGMPIAQIPDTNGDLYLSINLKMPQKITQEYKKLLEKIRKLH